jgi:hypothetical protein
VRPLVIGHDVYTVSYLGWSGTRNGALLRRAAEDGFDVLITQEGSIQHQQNPRTLPVAVLIVVAAKSDIDVLHRLVPAMLDGLNRIKPRTVLQVS